MNPIKHPGCAFAVSIRLRSGKGMTVPGGNTRLVISDVKRFAVTHVLKPLHAKIITDGKSYGCPSLRPWYSDILKTIPVTILRPHHPQVRRTDRVEDVDFGHAAWTESIVRRGVKTTITTSTAAHDAHTHTRGCTPTLGHAHHLLDGISRIPIPQPDAPHGVHGIRCDATTFGVVLETISKITLRK